jgi:hypothetical protein
MATLFTASIVANPTSVVENQTNTNLYGTFAITLSGGDVDPTNNRTFSVPYTVSGTASNGTDFSILSGTALVTVLAGATSGNTLVQVAPLDDTLVEGAETVTLTLNTVLAVPPPGYVLGPVNSATFTIIDNEPFASAVPEVDVTFSNVVSETGSPSAATFTFTRSGVADPNLPLTVGFTVSPGTAVAGTDYVNNLGNSITFAAGELSKTLTLTAIDDALFDPDETVTPFLPENYLSPIL